MSCSRSRDSEVLKLSIQLWRENLPFLSPLSEFFICFKDVLILLLLCNLSLFSFIESFCWPILVFTNLVQFMNQIIQSYLECFYSWLMWSMFTLWLGAFNTIFTALCTENALGLVSHFSWTFASGFLGYCTCSYKN